MSGPPVVIVESHGFPVNPVEGNAPVLTVAERGIPITISPHGAPFVVQGMSPPVPEGFQTFTMVMGEGPNGTWGYIEGDIGSIDRSMHTVADTSLFMFHYAENDLSTFTISQDFTDQLEGWDLTVNGQRAIIYYLVPQQGFFDVDNTPPTGRPVHIGYVPKEVSEFKPFAISVGQSADSRGFADGDYGTLFSQPIEGHDLLALSITEGLDYTLVNIEGDVSELMVNTMIILRNNNFYMEGLPVYHAASNMTTIHYQHIGNMPISGHEGGFRFARLPEPPADDPDVQAIISEFGSTDPFPFYEDMLDRLVNVETPTAMDVM